MSSKLDPSTQDAREQDYATSGVFRSRDDAGNLHAFFSPYIVPEGLTDEEIRMCLTLHRRREPICRRLSEKKKRQIKGVLLKRFEDDYFSLEEWQTSFARIFGELIFTLTAEQIAEMHASVQVLMYIPVPLQRELTQSPMTRESFTAGVRQLTELMDTLERVGG